MEWSRLYANLPDDPRVQLVEDQDGAGWLLIQSFCYCTRAESDGFIPHTQVPRFGGTRLRQKVAALVREKIWLPAEGGYVLDPTLWSEERNLSDRAERKRKADRERVAAKRAAARATQNGHLSRDSSATGSATGSSDSRPPEERREEKTPPLPPPRPLWPAAVPDPEGEGEDHGRNRTPAAVAALVEEIRAIRCDWARSSIKRALNHPDVLDRPWPIVARAALIVAHDSTSKAPGRLSHDGPWWHTHPGRSPSSPVTVTCSNLDHRQSFPAGAKCPGCESERKAAAS